MRTRRFFNDRDLVGLFKCHILSYVEYRTAAILHCCNTTLMPLDRVLGRFLEQIGMQDADAFSLKPQSIKAASVVSFEMLKS